VRRRDLIKIFAGLGVVWPLGGALGAWPIVAQAQQPDRIRRIGMLVGINDPDIKAFQQELERHGWYEGRNIHIDYRLAPAAVGVQALAKELVATQPDVIFALSRPATTALQKETQTIPIVFTYVIDPIGAGFITSLAHPGGNLTGIMAYEPSMVGKWLGMLKEIAPQTTRVTLLGNPKTAVYFDYLLKAAEASAPSLGIAAVPSRIENDAVDIERVIAGIASVPNSAMVVLLIVRLPSTPISLSRSRLEIAYRRFTTLSPWSAQAVSCRMGLLLLSIIDRQPCTSIKFFMALNRPTFRYRRPSSTRPRSILRRQKPSD
jgi:ABC transporter substrate binding protein